MNLEERITLHRRMAEAYRDAYIGHDVHEGGSYDGWEFADDAVLHVAALHGRRGHPVRREPRASGAAACATMEAKAYAVTFADWGPVEFKCSPADNGFVMRTRWEGHTKDGAKMGFYSIGFVDTNDQGQITRWETFPNDEEYGPFLGTRDRRSWTLQGRDRVRRRAGQDPRGARPLVR